VGFEDYAGWTAKMAMRRYMKRARAMYIELRARPRAVAAAVRPPRADEVIE
jgi:hypothetical protein